MLLGHAAAALAQDVAPVTVTTPIFGQVVTFKVPAGWKPAHEATQQGHYILEYIPSDQTVGQWTEMITVQGFRGFAENPQATPKNLLAILAGRIEQVCGPQAVIQSLGDLKIDSFDAHAGILGCPNFPRPVAGARAGQGEVAYYVAIKGTADVYLIHRAKRGDAFDKDQPPMTRASAPDILKSLQPIKICERSQPRSECWDRAAR